MEGTTLRGQALPVNSTQENVPEDMSAGQSDEDSASVESPSLCMSSFMSGSKK